MGEGVASGAIIPENYAARMCGKGNRIKNALT
jgi:hypothetical protein